MILYTFLALALGYLFAHVYVSMVFKPKKLRKTLRQQGVDGPPPMFLLGNILEIKKSRAAADHQKIQNPDHPPFIHDTASVFPFLEKWRKQYGSLFTFSLGKMQILYVSDPALVKEIAISTSLDLGRPSYQRKDLGPLLGQGILTSNGSTWAKQRKIMAPEFFMDKVKGMMNIITESAHTLVDSWNHEIEAHGKGGVLDIRVDNHLKRFSGDVISRACFGSSYSKGRDIFLKLDALQKLMYEKTLSSVGIPGLRYLPTKTNNQIRALEKEIGALILMVVKERREAGDNNDLLHSLLQGAEISSYVSSDAVDQFIVDNCRNIYLAGFETSAVSASWCLMLLAANPEWQMRARKEVEEVCQGRMPDPDMLRKMKLLHMVIQETMRLYPPAPTLSREALKDMKIGHLWVPKGFNIWTMVATLHTNTDIWGPDALEFNPMRFEKGIIGACKSPSSYMPFGFGQRVCLGQHLAMVELKLLMSLILSNFSFTLSSGYVHSPVMRMIIEPKHGVGITVTKLSSI